MKSDYDGFFNNVVIKGAAVAGSPLSGLSDHLEPLSYGIPSALGARDFFDVNASTIRHTI